MPNTLVHLGVQSLLQAPALRTRGRYLGLVWLGCVIPDVPWIASRVLGAVPNVNPYSLELYASVQASLLFSIVLCVAAAALLARPWFAVTVMSLNCALHLLLDAVEIKPGNGVHLVAPFSGKLTSFGFVWPEHWLIATLTALGMATIVYLIVTGRFGSIGEPLRFSAARAAVSALALLIYFLAPPLFTPALYAVDHRGIRTLLDVENRAGKPLAIDRDPVVTRDGRSVLITHYGEPLTLLGEGIPRSGTVSLRGHFVDAHTLQVTEIHSNAAGFRDLATIAGLAFAGLAWALGIVPRRRSSTAHAGSSG
jgi:hypothetical protein